MLGKKKPSQQPQKSDATVGSVDKRTSVLGRIFMMTRAIGRVVRRHTIITLLIGLLLITAGVYIASQQRDPEPVIKTGLDYDADYRKKLIEESGQSADYGDYLILGKQALEQKNYKAAEGYFKDAERLKGDDLDVLYALATIYRLKEDKPKTVEYYEKVISKASAKDSPYHSNLAIYVAEKRAIEAGNFDLKGVVPEGFNAL